MRATYDNVYRAPYVIHAVVIKPGHEDKCLTREKAVMALVGRVTDTFAIQWSMRCITLERGLEYFPVSPFDATHADDWLLPVDSKGQVVPISLTNRVDALWRAKREKRIVWVAYAWTEDRSQCDQEFFASESSAMAYAITLHDKYCEDGLCKADIYVETKEIQR